MDSHCHYATATPHAITLSKTWDFELESAANTIRIDGARRADHVTMNTWEHRPGRRITGRDNSVEQVVLKRPTFRQHFCFR